jgi:hypothetical protein
VLDHVLALLELHVRLAHSLLLALLFEDLSDLILELFEALSHGSDSLSGDDAVADLVGRSLLHDGLEHLAVRLANERDGPTLPPGTGRTTHAVRVLRELGRHVVVDDRLDALDVETTRGEVRSKQVVDFTGLKVVERDQTLLLRQVSVQFRSLETAQAKHHTHLVRQSL